MPYSDPDNKPWTTEKIKEINPKTVLDVGAGAGVYLDIIKNNLENDVSVEAVEIWEPYIKEFNLESKYNIVWNKDVRLFKEFSYDLVIFGDIMEHMTKEDAVKLWDNVSKTAGSAIISIPIVHYPQGHEHGNPYEEHVKDDWTTQEVLDTFSNITEYKEFDVTGVFIARFNNDIKS